MPAMEFCIGTCAKIDQIGMVKQAEDLGVSHFGVGEGPLLFSDPYQFLALAARDTSTINIGTMVTNPLTRIAPVTANSIATLHALAPGRTFFGIGTANNALRSMGKKPARIDQLMDHIRVTKGLLEKETVEHELHGETTPVRFLDTESGWYHAERVPIWVACGGPKGLAAAAQYADAIVYCLGPNADMIGLIRRELDKAVADAGRAPGSVKLVGLTWFYNTKAGETWEDAITQGFGSGPISSCLTNAGMMNGHVEELGADIVNASTQAAMAYLGDPTAADAPHYLDVWANYLRGLDPAHKPLITKQLVDYWALYGTKDEIQDKVALMTSSGVDMVQVFLSNPFTAQRDIADIGATVLAD
ncbi:LLM class flavin-dependent oxidoreductase [Kineosporia sp. R_H_3]|uniref:LLM class flavin-dependent oxidoreductase n=1 Tax=Kineosporia sp. R_H_3 TaxID=1961848 RepID=UPI0018E90CA6|nr:LLM class flavin-dependent oxidoreductase [Kineosporia sp. R_H_3]